MPGPLRHIAVFVSEPARSRFVWQLIEGPPGTPAASAEWTRLLTSKVRFTSYAEALAAGLEALQVQMDDPAVGPRSEEDGSDSGEDESADAAADAAADDTPAPHAGSARRKPSPPGKKAVPRKKAFFGFGPVK